MKYTSPTFTVAVGQRPAQDCNHGWVDARGRCVFCGDWRVIRTVLIGGTPVAAFPKPSPAFVASMNRWLADATEDDLHP